MYDQYLKVQPCKTGSGIFTTTQIPAHTPIVEFKGNICFYKDLPKNCDNYLQIGPDRFMVPTGTIKGIDFINHSCEPNCNMQVIGNRAILFSLVVIPVGMQLTFDYSTTSTDTLDEWKMECACGSPKCRKIISGYQYLSDDKKKEYVQRGMVPIFISNPTLINKKW